MCFEIKKIRIPVAKTSSNRSGGVSVLNMLLLGRTGRKVNGVRSILKPKVGYMHIGCIVRGSKLNALHSRGPTSQARRAGNNRSAGAIL